MASSAAEPVLIVSPRYADEVASAVVSSGMVARIERRPDNAGDRLASEPVRLVVVDARGALAQGLVVARDIGKAVELRRGAMLVLLSRTDASATRAAHDAGATAVLVSPFGNDSFGSALRLAQRNAQRLSDAAAALLEAPDAEVVRHDLLTGLATGDQLQLWLAMLVGLTERPQPVFVIVIGVGRFAQINAAYGREVADRVLSSVAQRLSHIVDARNHGATAAEARLLARLAAAEFAVGVAGPIVLGDVTRLANALVEAFDAPFMIGSHVIHLSGRAGIASHDVSMPGSSDDAGTAEDEAAAVIRRASAALASARTGDAGSVEVFQADPAGDPLTRLADLESDLHRAIDAGDIRLLFQPQLALMGERISGVEALVRWQHPELGRLPAETLLETAASAELAIKLGRHIRSRAIAAAAGWTGSLGRLKLSLNVTAADLADPGFAAALEAALAESGLQRNRLMLEVTEGALIEDMHGAVRLLEGLRVSGIKVALDDFGTGYSSLAWMARLPIDVIKLDRSFTLGLSASERERVVVETVITLSKRLGLMVIAEGVEDDAQLNAARSAGCDAVQGYHVALPMNETELADFCSNWSPDALLV